MGFLLKSAFWLSLVLLVIPLGGQNEDSAPGVGPLEAFFAARDAVGDLRGICEREPDVCVVGGAMVETIGYRAREGARLAYEAFETQPAGPQADEMQAAAPAGNDDISTGSIAVPSPRPLLP